MSHEGNASTIEAQDSPMLMLYKFRRNGAGPVI